MPKTKAMQEIMRLFEFSPVVQTMRESGMRDDEIIYDICLGRLDMDSIRIDVSRN